MQVIFLIGTAGSAFVSVHRQEPAIAAIAVVFMLCYFIAVLGRARTRDDTVAAGESGFLLAYAATIASLVGLTTHLLDGTSSATHSDPILLAGSVALGTDLFGLLGLIVSRGLAARRPAVPVVGHDPAGGAAAVVGDVLDAEVAAARSTIDEVTTTTRGLADAVSSLASSLGDLSAGAAGVRGDFADSRRKNPRCCR